MPPVQPHPAPSWQARPTRSASAASLVAPTVLNRNAQGTLPHHQGKLSASSSASAFLIPQHASRRAQHMQQNRVLPQNPRRPALHRQQNRVKDAFHFDFLAGEPPSGEKLLALYAEAFPLELITSNTETELKRDGDGGEGADGSESSGQLCLELSHSLLQGGGRRARGIESLHRGRYNRSPWTWWVPSSTPPRRGKRLCPRSTAK